jgi:hypothetical protein
MRLWVSVEQDHGAAKAANGARKGNVSNVDTEL